MMLIVQSTCVFMFIRVILKNLILYRLTFCLLIFDNFTAISFFFKFTNFHFRLLPLLSGKCREARTIAAFHFAMEAIIKKQEESLEIFQVFTLCISVLQVHCLFVFLCLPEEIAYPMKGSFLLSH